MTDSANQSVSNDDDICPRDVRAPRLPTPPHVPGIYPASVYRCAGPDQALAMLSGDTPGYIYQRDGHPNADMLAERCAELHHAQWAVITASGMSALSVAMLATCQRGDHIVVGEQLYGRSLQLLTAEANRLGIAATVVDTTDLAATTAAMTAKTCLLVVETISNPLLSVADIPQLAQLAHQFDARLLVDNTFATPLVCQPLAAGADLVLESVSKIMNGHSDVMLGLLCGMDSSLHIRARDILSIWGLASSPFDCWLAQRGLATLPLRLVRAMDNAQAIASSLCESPVVRQVWYPGLPQHPNHDLAQTQFRHNRFGWVVTFDLTGGLGAAQQFIAAADKIAFCPSLGEVSTTLSHPQSTSHRGLSADEQHRLGISGGTIRLSVGTESLESVLANLGQGLTEID